MGSQRCKNDVFLVIDITLFYVVSYATPPLRRSSDCTGEHIGPRTNLHMVGRGNIPALAVNQTSFIHLQVHHPRCVYVH
jgi:hypothetical protein